jgi:hypothetical protein
LGRGAQQAADDGAEGWRARWASRAAGMVPGLGRGGLRVAGRGSRVEGAAERESRRGRGRRRGPGGCQERPVGRGTSEQSRGDEHVYQLTTRCPGNYPTTTYPGHRRVETAIFGRAPGWRGRSSLDRLCSGWSQRSSSSSSIQLHPAPSPGGASAHQRIHVHPAASMIP